ncbi:transglycosylase SLT domain-containing protein [Nonomuraea sp. NPDC005983]|uniref:transglycosylase SLT domain-containing protein n=1 Tax=Nonomuraea sp. NPDC005983 TaxID=3155595 RepID=UPI0033BA5DE7
MSLREQIAALTGGHNKFTAVMDKVDGDPEEIRRIASRWNLAGYDAVGNMNVLAGAVKRVDDHWKGASADAFVTYMGKYGKAGQGMNDALVDCAGKLNDVADALVTAKTDVDRIGNLLLQQVAAERTAHKNDPDATQDDLDKAISGKISAAAGDAQPAVDKAESVMSTLLSGINKRFGEEKLLFSDIPLAGDQEFVPGPGHKVEWVAVSPSELERTQLAGGGSGGGGGTGASNGTGSYGYTGTSSGGTTPQPKSEVVKWIKEAIDVIKSPEMAAIMRKRGLDVSDLDPNDPKDIERIWTIIYHESGGNPSAINNWDINAQNGVPSQGLMQTIPPTFNAHSLPGHKQILEPVDNIIAGVLYTYSRYGDLAHHPGIASLESGGPYRPY